MLILNKFQLLNIIKSMLINLVESDSNLNVVYFNFVITVIICENFNNIDILVKEVRPGDSLTDKLMDSGTSVLGFRFYP